MKTIAENIWMLPYPLKMLGADLRRNVTIVRLASGRLVIHSTAEFSSADVAAIRALGEPGWLVEGCLRHDTFAKDGRAAFPGIPYLAPEGFAEEVEFATQPIVPPPMEWGAELEALEVMGAPSLRETVLFHAPSRSLIATELIFNFGDEPIWTELLLRVAVGAEHHPGMSRPVKNAVIDDDAFKTSMAALLAWNFDRVIVGHGDVIETGGKAKLCAALDAAGLGIGMEEP